MDVPFMLSEKVKKRPDSSFRRKPESRDFKKFWTPAFAGVTASETFYEAVTLSCISLALLLGP